jgi:hypothetical protein
MPSGAKPFGNGAEVTGRRRVVAPAATAVTGTVAAAAADARKARLLRRELPRPVIATLLAGQGRGRRMSMHARAHGVMPVTPDRPEPPWTNSR